jgi:5-methylcytosine-specific restriction endonuclease McrA
MKKNMEILNDFKNMEKNMEIFKCEICKREFKNLRGLLTHIGGTHKNEITVEEYYLKFIGEKGKCVECGKDTTFRSLSYGYSKFCSRKCSANSIETQNKMKETYFEKTGYYNSMQNPETRERSKQTYFEKTGYYHSMQNPETREKHINTCLENSGYRNPSQDPKNKEKQKQTCFENSGYENPMQDPKNKEKSKQTCFENSGYENPMQDPKNKEKSKQTYFEKTGYDHPMQNPVTREKSKVSNLKNSGYEYPSQDPKNKEKHKQTCLEKTGYDHQMKNPEIVKKLNESTLRNNNGVHPNKLTYKKCLEKYPLLIKVEELKEGPNGEILAHCKNVNCKNSKENGGYFEPTTYQLGWRKEGIDGNDTHYLYCCEECKHSCPLYHRSAAVLHNLLNENKEILYTSGEYSTWRTEVFARQLRESPEHTINYCEYCGTTENLHAHHIHPQKVEPGFALDPDNGMVVCEKCHYEKCHEKGTECSSGNLANKICK